VLFYTGLGEFIKIIEGATGSNGNEPESHIDNVGKN